MGGKKYGDFYSMIFQGVADTQQLVLFCIFMEIVDVSALVEVVVLDLQAGLPNLLPLGKGGRPRTARIIFCQA